VCALDHAASALDEVARGVRAFHAAQASTLNQAQSATEEAVAAATACRQLSTKATELVAENESKRKHLEAVRARIQELQVRKADLAEVGARTRAEHKALGKMELSMTANGAVTRMVREAALSAAGASEDFELLSGLHGWRARSLSKGDGLEGARLELRMHHCFVLQLDLTGSHISVTLETRPSPRLLMETHPAHASLYRLLIRGGQLPAAGSGSGSGSNAGSGQPPASWTLQTATQLQELLQV
jgi:hypothetical protein